LIPENDQVHVPSDPRTPTDIFDLLQQFGWRALVGLGAIALFLIERVLAHYLDKQAALEKKVEQLDRERAVWREVQRIEDERHKRSRHSKNAPPNGRD
jgi:hypothetical protein